MSQKISNINSKSKIFLVDSNNQRLRTLASLFYQEKIQVKLFKCGMESLAYLESLESKMLSCIVVIIEDLIDMPGVELAHLAINLKGFQKLKIIYFMNSDDPDSKEDMLCLINSGVEDIIKTPTDEKKMLSAIKTVALKETKPKSKSKTKTKLDLKAKNKTKINI